MKAEEGVSYYPSFEFFLFIFLTAIGLSVGCFFFASQNN